MNGAPAPAAARRSRNYAGPWPRTPGRLIGTGLVRAYQLTLSGFLGNHCRHMPTCSEYAYEAVARHRLLRGGLLAAWRVSRCLPGGTHGIDNVPETLPGGALGYLRRRGRTGG